MKKKYLKSATVAAIMLVFCNYNTNAQFGGLKNKVKNTADNVGNKDKNNSSSNSNNNKADVKIDANESGSDLAAKGDKSYEAEKWADALAYYEEAENRGYQDGMVKKRMNECRDNMDPAKQKEEEKQLAGAQGQLNQMEAMKYKCDKIPTDNGTSGPTHTKNQKKIVFSKSEIAKGKENEAEFGNSFSLLDNIYCRVYLDKSIGYEAKNIAGCFNNTNFIRFTFDDGATKAPDYIEHTEPTGIGAEELDKWTTWQPAILPSTADITFEPSKVKVFVKLMRYLPVGKHKVKMEIVYDIPEDSDNGYSKYLYTTKFGPEKVLSTGEFNITITEADKKAMYKKVCPLYKKDIDLYNKPAFTLVPNANELVKKATTVDWNKFTLLKVVSEETDWTYKKNVYGIILSRSCGAGAYLLNKEDNFIYYSSVTFYQENTSSGGSGYSNTTSSVEEQNIEYVRNYDSFCKECIGK